MTYDQIVELWNSQADEWNKWAHLSEQEKVEFAYQCGREWVEKEG